MLRAGVVLLTLWCGLNLLLAVGILAAMLVFGANAPGLSQLLSPADLAALDPRVTATVNAIAVLGNACIAALCFGGLCATWLGVARRVPRVAPLVFGALGFVQACGFASDAYLGNRNLAPNVVSTVVLALAGALTLRRAAAR